jgi:Uma2 family endonuclease
MSDKIDYTRPMTPSAPVTADELLYLNLPNKRTALVRGALVVREPAGASHGGTAARLLVEIGVFVRSRDLGAVFAAETGFVLFTNPDTVRAPDVAFIRRERVPVPLPLGYFRIPPDLAVEVTSPGDTVREVEEKVADWLAAGTRLVWVIDSRKRTARVHRASGSWNIEADGLLDGEDVLPGFRMALSELFR